MKLSDKLIKYITNFAEAYDGLKKATKDVAEQIEDMKKLTEDGVELKLTNFAQKTSVLSRKFSKSLEEMKDTVEEANVAIDDASVLATEESKETPEVEAIARKARIARKQFSVVEAKFSEAVTAIESVLDAKDAGTNIKDSVVPAAPERDPNADETVTNIKVSGNNPSKDIETRDPEVINAAESVNFSATQFVKFSLTGAIKAFTEFAEELADAGDLVAEMIEVTKPEPVATTDVTEPKSEVATHAAETPAVEVPKFDAESVKADLINKGIEAIKAGDNSVVEDISAEAQKLDEEVPGAAEEVITAIENFAKENKEMNKETTDVCPACGQTPCVCESSKEVVDYTKDQEKLVEEGIKAFAKGDKDSMKKVVDFCSELETLKKGAGEEVVSTIENFATLFKLGFKNKNFEDKDNAEKTEKDISVFGKMKDLVAFAAEKMVAGDKWDTDAFASKCDDLEQMQPGAGEVIVSVLENFTKVANDIKEKMTPETEEKVMKEFSEALEKFVEEIPVADKTFAHKLKKACFEALEFCDKNDRAFCVKFCEDVSKGLADPTITDQKVKDFGKSLEDFCGRLAKFSVENKAEIPEEVSKGDNELNEVLEKMGEKGAQLDAKTSTFATKLCDSYKSMKCFTEEQLESKIKLVEDLKASFSEVGVNFAEEPASPEVTTEVKVDSPETEENKPIIATPEDTIETAEEAPVAKPETTEVETQEAAPEAPVASEETTEVVDDYDPTAIAERTDLIEEEEVPESSQPSDDNIAIPVNFSAEESYEGKFDTIFGL